ncbi:response regulator transcription factor [Actinomyces urogenitalis]|uniref:response regulator transcription factor n=1 Tax=Actinomyces urogenitalis TaxID=103621 RepID=UPI00242E166D|nr:response regulator transcription factor [Actinomyces urogenitalis]MCI7457912.1 response regulator transcription factor [Actinomyces urogenitalis]
MTTQSGPIQLLVADDQALVRGALATLLGLERDLEVVAQVGTGRQAVERVRSGGVDVALLDIEMPDGDGLWAAEQIARLRSAGTTPCRSIIVTTFGRPGYLSRAIEVGASGFLVKDTPPAELAEAVRKVHAGLRVIDPMLAQESVLLGPNPLTEREREVLRLAGKGLDAPHIAARLSLGEGTVRNYLSSAIAKTGSRNRVEAARAAESNGWL